MIDKFNNIWYLTIFLIHFIGIGAYAYQTIFQTRKFCTKFEIDDTGFTMVRFAGAFMLGQVLMAIYILFIRRNGVVANNCYVGWLAWLAAWC